MSIILSATTNIHHLLPIDLLPFIVYFCYHRKGCLVFEHKLRLRLHPVLLINKRDAPDPDNAGVGKRLVKLLSYHEPLCDSTFNLLKSKQQ